jgi:hypothetical protein
MRPISTGDKLRIALAPIHVAVGGTLLYQYWLGPRTPMVAILGVLFTLFGGYRITLIYKALKKRASQ